MIENAGLVRFWFLGSAPKEVFDDSSLSDSPRARHGTPPNRAGRKALSLEDPRRLPQTLTTQLGAELGRDGLAAGPDAASSGRDAQVKCEGLEKAVGLAPTGRSCLWSGCFPSKPAMGEAKEGLEP